jgi:hypothetical protein
METRTAHVVVIINYDFLWLHYPATNKKKRSEYQENVRKWPVVSQPPPRPGAAHSGRCSLSRPAAPAPCLDRRPFFGLLGSETPIESAGVTRPTELASVHRPFSLVMMTMTSKISGPARNPRERTYQRCTRGSCPDALALTTRSSILVYTANADRPRIHDHHVSRLLWH